MLNSLSLYTRDNIIYDKIGVEAGYVNNPADPGGETKWGMTARTLATPTISTALKTRMGWSGRVADLTKEQAAYAYVIEFWQPMQLDKVLALGGIAVLIADILFSIGINQGMPAAISSLQKTLNAMNNQQTYYADIATDGVMGPGTINALQKLIARRANDGVPDILFMIACFAAEHYYDIVVARPSQEVFFIGWVNRARNQYDTYARLRLW